MKHFQTPFENQLGSTIRETMWATRNASGLSIEAKYLLQELSLQANGFVPRREWVKKVLQKGEHVTRRVLSELRDGGYLITRHYRDPDTGRVVGKAFVFLKQKIVGAAKRFARSIGQTDEFDVIDAPEMGFTCVQQYRDRYNVDARWQSHLQQRFDAGKWLTESEIAQRRAAKAIEKRGVTETSVSANPNTITLGEAIVGLSKQFNVSISRLHELYEDHIDRQESEKHLGF